MSISDYNNTLSNIKRNKSLSLIEKRKQIVALNKLYKAFNGHGVTNYI